MVEVRLHGALAAEFGRVWNLEVSSTAEAVSALSTLRPRFRAAIMRLHKAGSVFRIRTRAGDLIESELHLPISDGSRIDIIPIIAGASAGVRFVVGVALMVVGVAAAGFLGPAAPYVVAAGFSLAVGSVVQWLTPVPPRTQQESATSLESWTISGPTNTGDQGSPVPIIYGEVLTGATAISAGISVDQITSAASVDLKISGNSEIVAYSTGFPLHTVVINLSGSLNSDVKVWAWTYSGFPLATAKRLVSSNSATVRLELDYDISVNASYQDTGQVNLTVDCYTKRKSTSASYEEDLEVVSQVSATRLTTVYVTQPPAQGERS